MFRIQLPRRHTRKCQIADPKDLPSRTPRDRTQTSKACAPFVPPFYNCTTGVRPHYHIVTRRKTARLFLGLVSGRLVMGLPGDRFESER